jgi:hypothetical protein
MILVFPRMIKRAHHVYTHREIDDVLEYLTQPELPRGAIPQIFRDMGLPRQTLQNWHGRRYQEDGSNWFPLAEGHPHAQALSDENETGIADFIRTNYIRAGKGATRGLLQSLRLDSYVPEKEDEWHRDRFAASSIVLSAFERRQGLSLRSPHHERRSILNENYVDYLLKRLNSLSKYYQPELIFNMDETSW